MDSALIAQLALATFVACQFTKFMLDGFISASNPNRANITRLFVYGVAVAVCGLALPLAPLHGYADGLTDAKTLLVDGFQVFAAAVGSYHIANGLDAPALLSSVVGIAEPLEPASFPEPAPATVAPEPTPAPIA